MEPVEEHSRLMFPSAPQPDVVRSSQKDDYYKRQLYNKCFDLSQHYLGPRQAMNLKEELQLLSDASYYGLSTLIGRPTLGEEYCDLTLVKVPSVQMPTTLDRIVMLSWHVLIPYAYNKGIKYLTRLSRPRPYQLQESDSSMKESNRKLLEKWIPHLKSFMEIMQRIHLGVFYLFGSFYHFSKRMTNIRYILNREVDEYRPSYNILGVLIMIQLLLSFLLWVKELKKKKGLEEDKQVVAVSHPEWVVSKGTCSLCLSTRTNPTATTCGHLFCWDCIMEWCNNKPECPLCRTPQKHNELIPVYNFN